MNKTMLRFRVWDSEHKKFIKSYQEIGKYFHGFCNDSGNEINIGISFWEVPDGYFRILKSTGLKDKNNIEVFEGDIFKNGTWEDNRIKKPILYIVEWKESCWGWKQIIPVLTFEFEIKDVEVIGNIFENEELLKEVNK